MRSPATDRVSAPTGFTDEERNGVIMGGVIRVRLNGEDRSFPDGCTVADMVATLRSRGRGTAVALNGEVVPRSHWPTAGLAEGDAVEVLTAAQGG